MRPTQDSKVLRILHFFFSYLCSLPFETEDLWLRTLYRGEEVTVHNSGITLLLSISVSVLLTHSSPECDRTY